MVPVIPTLTERQQEHLIHRTMQLLAQNDGRSLADMPPQWLNSLRQVAITTLIVAGKVCAEHIASLGAQMSTSSPESTHTEFYEGMLSGAKAFRDALTATDTEPAN